MDYKLTHGKHEEQIGQQPGPDWHAQDMVDESVRQDAG